MSEAGVKWFRDNIHGYIEVPETVVKNIIDTELFQRLKDVDQTGMSPLYPTARHSRFSHSLGVYHLGKKAFHTFKRNVGRLDFYREDAVILGLAEQVALQDSGKKLPTSSEVTDDWWRKYQRLFELACLLHDCAHAPYSHAYERYYSVETAPIDEDWCEQRGLTIKDFVDRDVPLKMKRLDKELLSVCRSREFFSDYMPAFEQDTKADSGSVKAAEEDRMLQHKSCKEHEKLSSTVLGLFFKDACQNVLSELDTGNKLVTLAKDAEPARREASREADVEFMVRCIIGLKYSVDVSSWLEDNAKRFHPQPADRRKLIRAYALETSLKNCLIELLNSSKFDVDGLDYIARDAKNAGLSTGDIDYDRLLSALSAMRVIHYRKREFADNPVDGLWLKGSQLLFDPRSQDAPEPHPVASNPKDDEGAPKEFAIKEIDDTKSQLEIAGTCRLDGRFTGTVSGQRVCQPDDIIPSEISEQLTVEYAPAYDASCLRVIDQIMAARNYEQEWIFTHPKLLYTFFLLGYMPRLASRYVCCMVHPEALGFDANKLEFADCDCGNGKTCPYCQPEDDATPSEDPDVLVPMILGFDSFYAKSPEAYFAEGQEPPKDRPRKYLDHGYCFWRSSDSDMRALFKRVYLENGLRRAENDDGQVSDIRSETIEKYFGSYFKRDHQMPLWKSQAEYREIFGKLLDDKEKKDRLEHAFLYDGKRLIKDFRILNGKMRSAFEARGMKNPVVVRAVMKPKRIIPEELFVITGHRGILPLPELGLTSARSSVRPEEFFYVFCDRPAKGESALDLSVESIRELFDEILEEFPKWQKEIKDKIQSAIESDAEENGQPFPAVDV